MTVVVRGRGKGEYLEALHRTDVEVGPVPSDGAHAGSEEIRPFLRYFSELVAREVYHDVLFVSERGENVWWYDGERVAFRTPSYTRILDAMRTRPTLTLAEMGEMGGGGGGQRDGRAEVGEAAGGQGVRGTRGEGGELEGVRDAVRVFPRWG